MKLSNRQTNELEYSILKCYRVMADPDAEWSGLCDEYLVIEDLYDSDDEEIPDHLIINIENLERILDAIKSFKSCSGFYSNEFAHHESIIRGYHGLIGTYVKIHQ